MTTLSPTDLKATEGSWQSVPLLPMLTWIRRCRSVTPSMHWKIGMRFLELPFHLPKLDPVDTYPVIFGHNDGPSNSNAFAAWDSGTGKRLRTINLAAGSLPLFHQDWEDMTIGTCVDLPRQMKVAYIWPTRATTGHKNLVKRRNVRGIDHTQSTRFESRY